MLPSRWHDEPDDRLAAPKEDFKEFATLFSAALMIVAFLYIAVVVIGT